MKKHSLAWLGHMPVAACLLMGNLAQAEQRSFTPQAGTWVVSAEVNGKPGRGLAIDVQEDTFFMQVYNYKANGEATFHTALGELKGNTVTAPLTHYEGGRYFGSGPLTAHEAGNAGNVTITFTSGLTGTVQFPGETPVKIERFLVGDSADVFSPQNDALMRSGQNAVWATVDDNAAQQIWESKFLKTSTGYQLTLRPMSLVVVPPATFIGLLAYDCQRATDGSQGYDCTQAAEPNSTLDYMPKINFRYAGADVTGTVVASKASGKVLNLMGHLLSNGAVPSASASDCQPLLQSFVPGNSCNGSRMPINGTWVVADELNGKPGRGISLDMQNGYAIVQIFDYLNSGTSTFHMGSASYSQSAADIDVYRYGSGRYFGSPALTAHEVEDVGPVSISLQDAETLVEGTIQFPGEAAKKIVRLGLTAQNLPEESLLGEWHMVFSSGNLKINTRALLDHAENGEARNSAGNIRCKFATAAQEQVTCKLYSNDAVPKEMGSTSFAFNGYLPGVGTAFRIKDRKGNLLGL